jgi:hypothetical protein
MSDSDVIRWGGLAAMVAGVVFIFYWLFALANPQFPFLGSILILAELLVLVGLVGFHALQKGSYGRIGRAGFYTAIVAILVHVVSLEAIFLGGGVAFGWLERIGILGQLIGLALYGAATLQAVRRSIHSRHSPRTYHRTNHRKFPRPGARSHLAGAGLRAPVSKGGSGRAVHAGELGNTGLRHANLPEHRGYPLPGAGRWSVGRKASLTDFLPAS